MKASSWKPPHARVLQVRQSHVDMDLYNDDRLVVVDSNKKTN
jgi:hypothetical protein